MTLLDLFNTPKPFKLECGHTFSSLKIAYHTFGKPSNPVIWICHALTANSNPEEWWEGLVGDGKLFNAQDYYIICANMLGSCYGSTHPLDLDSVTGEAYKLNFPLITIRDMANAHEALRSHLGIEKIDLILGGSTGGQQALEYTIMYPERVVKASFMACNAYHSPWGIAFNEAQRMSIMADHTIHDTDAVQPGQAGLQAARAIAMLSYRNYNTYLDSQKDDIEVYENHRASSYQRYQGLKLSNRFDAFSYLSLTKSMDSNNVGRGRGSIEKVLNDIKTKCLIVGISSDVLFPIGEQEFLAQYIPNAQFEIIDSDYGHDGFLIEFEKIGKLLADFLSE